MEQDDLDFVAVMARIGRDNRDLYRQLRAEAWEMVRRNHEKRSAKQLEVWKRNAS